MQTNELSLASGIPKLSPESTTQRAAAREKGTKMSKTAAVTLDRSTKIFTRLMAAIDRLLAASARIAVRNGDLPPFGL